MREAVLCLALLLAGCGEERRQTALDRYVAEPDPSYRYELVNTFPGEGFTAYVLDMISQRWRTGEEVDRTLWQHWVTIVKPDRVESATGLLVIGGGSNDSKPPAMVDPVLASIAVGTGAVVAELRMVPNQPLSFAGDTMPRRSEDSLVAYTWDKYLRTSDESWPARLPMTKSAVRAMDTVTAFCRDKEAGGVAVDRFVVAGGSKRGWTTWTAAAVDRRVVAVVPLVIDMLNLEKSFVHHWRAYGFWAPAVKDYEDMRIMRWMGTPEFQSLMRIVEPYEYRHRLTVPKFIVNSTGDEFFLPDSSQFYFDDLPGEKHLRYVPNTNHSLRDSDAVQSVAAFFESIVKGTRRPKFSWTLEGGRAIRVLAADPPTEVKLWQASNPTARDFRLETIGAAWRSTTLEDQGGGVYVGSVELPAEGWTALMVELTFPSGGKHPFKFTTQVRVVPDNLPFPPPERVTPN